MSHEVSKTSHVVQGVALPLLVVAACALASEALAARPAPDTAATGRPLAARVADLARRIDAAAPVLTQDLPATSRFAQWSNRR